MDEETLDVLREGQLVEDFVNSDGWRYAKDKLETILKKVDAISSLPEGLTREQKLEEMDRRQGAISLVREWMNLVEGRAAQHANNGPLLTQQSEDIIINL